MAKHVDFRSIFTEAEKSPAYRVERAVLDFTEDIVARMDREGVSRVELARRIGCSPAYVTKILRGTTNFTLESMVRVATALGCEFRTHLQPNGADLKKKQLDRPVVTLTPKRPMRKAS